jgi:hypothetical protein
VGTVHYTIEWVDVGTRGKVKWGYNVAENFAELHMMGDGHIYSI